MSKKNFKGNFNKLLGNMPTSDKKKPEYLAKKSIEENLPSDPSKPLTTRATFIVNKQSLEELKDIAFWDRALIKEVLDDALSSYIKNWKSINGPIKPRKK
tara:strand:+ start:173 stop:472 length:300 start_codon:yes stop_codon:yes gene_type:complete